MGRRKKNAPRRGSLAYLPRGRAARPVGKVNYWPEVKGDLPTILGFAGYKAGMTYVYIVSDRLGRTYGQEVITPVTVVEAPPIVVCGFRSYSATSKGLRIYAEVWMENPPKDLMRTLTLPEHFDTEADLKKIKESIDKVSELRAILCMQPRLAAISKKKPEIIEVKIGGGKIEDRLNYLEKILGKEIRVQDIFKEGQFVDVIAITKGKGIQGPVKRWGVKTLHHKSRKTVRGIGTLGAFNPSYVMYTVPRAGQMGYHKRTELNKRVLKISSEEKEIMPESGFSNYGPVKSDYIVLSGSIPGPAKRLITIRYPTHPPSTVSKTPPKITFVYP